MVDAQLVAVLDSVENLQESLLGKQVVANIVTTLGDVEKQVAFGAVLQNNVDAVDIVHDLVNRYDVAMRRSLVVQVNFPLLVCHLAALKRRAIGIELAQALDSIANACGNVNGRVNYTVGTSAENVSKLQSALKKASEALLWGQRHTSHGLKLASVLLLWWLELALVICWRSRWRWVSERYMALHIRQEWLQAVGRRGVW